MFHLRKHDGLLVISAILITSITLSFLHIAIFGYGVKIEKIEISHFELVPGEILDIDVLLKNNEQEPVGIAVVKTRVNSISDNLKILTDEIMIKRLSKSSLQPVSIQIQANENATEEDHEIIISLLLNEHEIDKKIIYLKTLDAN